MMLLMWIDMFQNWTAGKTKLRGLAYCPLEKFSGKSRPSCFLKMTKNQLLTKVGFEKDVRHFEFAFVSSAVEYEVGDVLEVLPSQDPEAVDTFLQRCNLNPEAFITRTAESHP